MVGWEDIVESGLTSHGIDHGLASLVFWLCNFI